VKNPKPPDLEIDVEASYEKLTLWAENFCPIKDMENVLVGNKPEKCPPLIIKEWRPKVPPPPP